MSKMREAMCEARIKFANSTADNSPYTWFEAGYQAAIAAVKEGGVALEVIEEWVDHGDCDQGNELICKPLKKLALGDKLYRITEDNP